MKLTMLANRLELTLFHLVREREDVLDKLERVHQRRLESS